MENPTAVKFSVMSQADQVILKKDIKEIHTVIQETRREVIRVLRRLFRFGILTKSLGGGRDYCIRSERVVVFCSSLS